MSFWVSADQHVGFKAAYDRQLAPLLANHELIESSAPDQLQTEGICSHWFEDPSPSALSHKRQRLLQDPHYREILLDWGRVFGTARPGAPMRYSFEFHALRVDLPTEPPPLIPPRAPPQQEWDFAP